MINLWSRRIETYQDLKTNLGKYTFYTLILEIPAFLWFNPKFELLKELLNLKYQYVFIPTALFASFFLISFFEFHDKIYDKYLIRWRKSYDLQFILPKLVSPHQNKIDRNFFETAEKNRDKFMQHLFYTFVGDRKSNKTVDINFRVRFYESIMKYWITQINEVFLIFWTVFIIIYLFVPELLFSHKAPKVFLFMCLLAIIVFFCINRILRKKWAIPQVKEKTSAEIDEIHKNHSQQLESEIRYVHKKFDLSYGS